LLGYAGKRGHLIQSADGVDSLPDMRKACLVSQTTFDKQIFEVIAARLRSRFATAEIVVKKTICSATEQRQAEMRQLASMVDAIVVVGGRNSANTQRLATIAAECGAATQLVETEREINWPALQGCETVGVTAGASTPNWMITSVVDRLHYLAERSARSPVRLLHSLVDVVAHCNVFVASGAAALFYVSCKIQALPFRWTEAIIAFLYFLSMYLWNSLTSLRLTQHHGISRYQFYSEHKQLLFALSGVSIIAVLAMSFLVNRNIFYLMLFATVAGTIYHFSFVPKGLRRFVRYANLKDIPTSRDLFVALAWGVLLTFLPYAESLAFRLSIPVLICFLWVGFLAFIRSLIFDLRDIEGDRIMGRETLVTIVGENRARGIILTLIKGLLGAAVLYSVNVLLFRRELSTGDLAVIVQFPVLLYLYQFIKSNRSAGTRNSSLFNLLADGQFFLSALLVWLATLVV
jgi:4-hydroxybenzoate polyprenyltransferase